MVLANSERALPIEIACVGEYGAPRLASLDTDILIWAEQQDYVVVSGDVKTMPETLARHLRNGRRLPGIFLILGCQGQPRISLAEGRVRGGTGRGAAPPHPPLRDPSPAVRGWPKAG